MADIKEIMISSQVSKVGNQKAQKWQRSQAQPTERFDQALETAQLNLSKHAQKRLEAREISFTESDHLKLSEAMTTLEKKGARDSLVLMGELAFVVNVPNKTVVTAMDREQMKEQVFTNIDSTILVSR